MIRVVSIALLLVVSLAGSASGECAWVLWTRTQAVTALKEDPWAATQAFETRAACIDAMRAMANRMNVPKATLAEDIAGGSFLVLLGSALAFTSGKCLPDTVDPREPKGK